MGRKVAASAVMKVPHVGVRPETYTEIQKRDVVRWLSTLPLSDLRHRQGINKSQREHVHRTLSKHPRWPGIQLGKTHSWMSDALDGLCITSELLILAVDRAAFGVSRRKVVVREK